MDMKLIITGASGFVGTELLKQSLRIPAIKTVIALTRQPLRISAESSSDSDHSKLKNIVVEGYDQYSVETKSEFATADACIWTVAITPSKSTLYDWNEICRVCYESPLAGLRAMLEARSSSTTNNDKNTPFRFIYMSGAKTERDQSKTPSFKPEYSLLRGKTETAVLALAKEHEAQLDACVVKPGLITAPNDFLKMAVACALWWTVSLPSIGVREISTAMLNQSLFGFEKDTLENDDLLRLGESEL
ncbi:putative nucleoside-diphosphate-sugar epimerase [Colletotrichum scovillei]|uniref:Nucleoside-diphosphate-sugar epimerase n=1 Tax=Colletotrichum scovillei TaxID=1209932 RepID=A0A9P7R5F9_9PEZI|nr:putative nucleoside-diphosphate-sugar epimerase [Colletotrichum scovillei]KAG7068766.1 putative nucleoside-diphosphate-sugar epimerase [Colletotrichum scovillei]KAG7072724.1 putative nucleoside-diphosphate-sugar epimerase [Colletotrichum scovillei]